MTTRTIRIKVDASRLAVAARAEEFVAQASGRDPLRRFDLEASAIIESENSFRRKVENSNRKAQALRDARASALGQSIESAMPTDDALAPAMSGGMAPI